MRTQITAYLPADTKRWLRKYARECGQKESEVVRSLVERERQIKWLRWAQLQLDPAQGRTFPLAAPKNNLPPKWSNPLRVPPSRKARGSGKMGTSS
jgi:hypothetical protein